MGIASYILVKILSAHIEICENAGSALHCNLDEHLSKEQYLKLIDFAVQEGTSYFTFNIPNSKCENCGHIVKAPIKVCPKCSSENITWYTRIIGYLRPISSFSKDRQIEAAKRTYTPYGDYKSYTPGLEEALNN